ncbi:LUD domain-containing protein [Candidatus Amesbacteria bacterium]|nr:LUD domain-containing protein [Candidatus Amesbacteria bacterium]
MKDFGMLADETVIQKTVEALKANGVDAIVVENGVGAKTKVLELLPEGAEVMTMSSETLKTIGLTEADTVKEKLKTMEDGVEKKRLGAAPEWAIGSAHAVTEDGKVMIASNTGSQLPAYVYGAAHVIWVVGTQKIVKDLDAGMKRIYEYVLPWESERVKKVYGMPGSNVSKLLIVNKEIVPGRITMILVREKVGM